MILPRYLIHWPWHYIDNVPFDPNLTQISEHWLDITPTFWIIDIDLTSTSGIDLTSRAHLWPWRSRHLIIWPWLYIDLWIMDFGLISTSHLWPWRYHDILSFYLDFTSNSDQLILILSRIHWPWHYPDNVSFDLNLTYISEHWLDLTSTCDPLTILYHLKSGRGLATARHSRTARTARDTTITLLGWTVMLGPNIISSTLDNTWPYSVGNNDPTGWIQ